MVTAPMASTTRVKSPKKNKVARRSAEDVLLFEHSGVIPDPCLKNALLEEREDLWLRPP